MKYKTCRIIKCSNYNNNKCDFGGECIFTTSELNKMEENAALDFWLKIIATVTVILFMIAFVK